MKSSKETQHKLIDIMLKLLEKIDQNGDVEQGLTHKIARIILYLLLIKKLR